MEFDHYDIKLLTPFKKPDTELHINLNTSKEVTTIKLRLKDYQISPKDSNFHITITALGDFKEFTQEITQKAYPNQTPQQVLSSLNVTTDIKAKPKMTWLQINKNNKNFIEEVCDHALTADNSFPLISYSKGKVIVKDTATTLQSSPVVYISDKNDIGSNIYCYSMQSSSNQALTQTLLANKVINFYDMSNNNTDLLELDLNKLSNSDRKTPAFQFLTIPHNNNIPMEYHTSYFTNLVNKTRLYEESLIITTPSIEALTDLNLQDCIGVSRGDIREKFILLNRTTLLDNNGINFTLELGRYK
jgi:hypothetical protein